jgi:hypothetical protein
MKVAEPDARRTVVWAATLEWPRALLVATAFLWEAWRRWRAAGLR